MEEQRSRMRVNFQTTVELQTKDGRLLPSASRDLSLRGVFVMTGAQLPLGAPCQLTIQLTGGSSKTVFAAEGIVARQAPDGLGIEFTTMDTDSFFHLRNIVLYNSEDPDGFLVECENRPGFR